MILNGVILGASSFIKKSCVFSGVNNIFSNISTVMIYISLFMKDVLSQYINNSVLYFILGFGLISGLMSIAYRAKVLSSFSTFTTLYLAICFWIASALFLQYLNFSAYYVAIPIAFILANQNVKLFLILMYFHFTISILIQAFEYVNGYYVFNYIKDSGIVFSEKLFGGHAEIMRSKGLFQGPLSAVAFALWMAIFSRMEIRTTVMLFISAFLASGRLGMLVAIIFILIHFLSARNVFSIRKFILGMVIFSIFVFGVIISSQAKLDFIMAALNFETAQNLSRLNMWLKSFNVFIEYNAIHSLFGDYEAMRENYFSTENDYFGILLNGGFFLFLIYLVGLFYIFKHFVFRLSIKHVLIPFLVVSLMFAFPFLQSLPMGVLFWVFVFMLTMQKRKQY